MPYIEATEREGWTCRMLELCNRLPEATEGALNFVITKLLCAWLGPKPSYSNLNAAIGVLECAKLELYRRMAAPYEDGKIAKNGDVYP